MAKIWVEQDYIETTGNVAGSEQKKMRKRQQMCITELRKYTITRYLTSLVLTGTMQSLTAQDQRMGHSHKWAPSLVGTSYLSV